MSKSTTILYQIVIVPPLFVFRILKAIVGTPISFVLWLILLPFRIFYAFFGSLWWLLPFGGRRDPSNPPSLTDFILASLFIGLIAGVVLSFTSFALLSLPGLLGLDSIFASTDPQSLIPSRRQIEKRLREQAGRLQPLKTVNPENIRSRERTYGRPVSTDQSQSRADRSLTFAQEYERGKDVDEAQEKRQQQQRDQDLSPRSQNAPPVPMSPRAGRDGIGVAGETIVEESTDDDLDYF